MTPILLFFVTLTAARAPGKITPTTGIGKAALISSNATAVAVLHAITSIFIRFFNKKSAISQVN